MRALIISAVLVSVSGWAMAQAPYPHADWNGFWDHETTVRLPFNLHDPNIPLTPEYAAKRDATLVAEKDGRYLHFPQLNCIWEGMPSMMTGANYGMQVLVTPEQVTIITELMNQVRTIYIDAKPPEDPDPSFAGTSVGHWEGDTLVVETMALRDDGIITPGLPHSGEMKILERIRLTDANTLRDDITLIDSKALTKPWSGSIAFDRQPNDRKLREYVCPAGNRKRLDKDGRLVELPWANE